MGFITSFQKINEKIIGFRNIQFQLLYEKMPTTFLIRCSDFILYMRNMEGFFELKEANLEGLMSIMMALKSFEEARELCDLESEIVEEIFGMTVAILTLIA